MSAEAVSARRALRILVPLAVIALIAFTLRDVRWPALREAVAAAHPGWIALAAAVNLLVLGAQALRWLALVRPLSRAATPALAFKALVIGFAASLVVPARAGDLARAHFMAEPGGLSRAAALGTIVLDYVVNAAGLVAGLALLPVVVSVPSWLRPGSWVALALFVAGVVVVFLLRPPAEAPPSARPARNGWRGLVDRARVGLTGLRDPRALALSFAASLVAWLLEVVVVALALWALDLHPSGGVVFLVLMAVNVALVFPFAPPGNAGTLELGAMLPLLAVGVAKERALAFALCYHLLQVVPIAVLGLLFAGSLARVRALAQAPVSVGVES